ncbi:carboxymuconolactone decarboxylase family protein [Pseudonocardia sp. MH-G8]|uniref:carboxymuconolactone decarboxylase family protein n=1 Tax=Pseudonocardia sp. MH-G8 TaxID=1854588 RepID=UPI000BA070B1|nr:carboxymuconolactone decarboxylase family protein [Pseudonocardia sp. MH-G8]OZM80676.1 4-carboxymuconolactone decarboxylase [Pseudonocardia sp. MH-G8]
MRGPGDASIADGVTVRRAVFGAELVERNYTNASDFSRPAQDWIAGAVWADVWAREGLDRRTRSLVTLAMLIALDRPTEFESHIRGALANGCSVADIQELLLHTAPYCGAPAALQAFRQAERVLTEADAL